MYFDDNYKRKSVGPTYRSPNIPLRSPTGPNRVGHIPRYFENEYTPHSIRRAPQSIRRMVIPARVRSQSRSSVSSPSVSSMSSLSASQRDVGFDEEEFDVYTRGR
jgi:hypothetical protein